MRSLVRALVMVSVIASAGPALAIPLVIDVIPRPGFPVPDDPDENAGFGAWSEDGTPNGTYLVGFETQGTFEAPTYREWRNFFTFDLSPLTPDLEILSAAFEVRAENMEGIGLDPVHYALFDVDTSVDRLFGATDPDGSIFGDLGSGSQYGVLAVDGLAIPGFWTDFLIPLNASALADLSDRRGGLFSIGGALLEPPTGIPPPEGRFLFAFGSVGGPQRLVLDVVPVRVPEPATWLLLGLGLVGLRVLQRRFRLSTS